MKARPGAKDLHMEISFQTKRFRFHDQKSMLKYKLSISSRNLCQVV